METTEPKTESPPRKRRWFQYSLRTMLVVMLLASVAMSLIALKIQRDRPVLLTTADDVARYQGHRYRVWVFDEKTREVRGFSDVVLRPGQSARLEPVAGVWIDVQLEGPMRQDIWSGDRIVEQYDAVGYLFKHRGGGEEGAASIIWPSLDVERRIARGYNAVIFSLPVGPKAAESLAAKLPAQFRGTRDEVEDALLACLPEYAMLFSEDHLDSLYQMIGPTRQPASWRRLLEDPRFRIRAALVLALAGDQEATEVLCQEGRPDTLARLPASAFVLEQMVSMIVQDEPLPDRPPDKFGPRPDPRSHLVRAITTKYPRGDVLPYAPQLLRRAKDCNEPWANDLRKYLSEPTTESRPARD